VNRNKTGMDTRSIALSAIFSALAIMLTMINITIPFPLLPYLKFDFSEIPVTMAFFLIGPQYALLSTAIYWVVLTIRAGDILGPAMKGAAVASMILGLWAASKVTNGSKAKGIKSLITSGLVIGGLLRVVVLSLFNYVVLTVIAPFWLDYATGLVALLGLPTATASQTIIWVLLLTGLYNFLHTALSMIPSVFITEATINRVPNLAGNSWITQYRNKKQA
jgi:riboflavin transporter FmnP